MTEVTATVGSAVGLHARPVSIFTRAVRTSGIAVQISRKDGPAVNAASPLLVMSLGIGSGEEVILSSEAPDSLEALQELADLVAKELDHKE